MKKLIFILLFFLLTACEGNDRPSGENCIAMTRERIGETSSSRPNPSPTTTTTVYHPGNLDSTVAGDNYNTYGTEDTNTDEEGSSFAGELFAFLFKSLWYAISNPRYTDYPYEAGQNVYYVYPPSYRYVIESNAVGDFKSRSSPFSLHAETAAAYLLADTYSASAKLSFNLSGFHMNALFEKIFSGSQSIYLFTYNAGFSIVFPDFMITGFLGLEFTDMTGNVFFSRGVQLQIFFPAKITFDGNYMRSSVNYAVIDRLDLSIGYTAGRFQFGAGFIYENFSGISYYGPLLKISFWI